MSPEDKMLEYLILSGAIEVAAVDSQGQLLYAFTPKIHEIMPDLFEEHLKAINEEIMFLWTYGFIDIDFLAENPMITITKKALDEKHLEELEPNRRNALEEIKRLLRKY